MVKHALHVIVQRHSSGFVLWDADELLDHFHWRAFSGKEPRPVVL